MGWALLHRVNERRSLEDVASGGFPEAAQKMAAWVSEGKIQARYEIVDGLANAPEALLQLFDGRNRGKLMVRVTPEV